MNPYMELPKLNLPAAHVTPDSASLDQQVSALAYRAVNAAEALGAAVHRFVEGWRERQEIRRSIAELSALNDNTLKDIGIDRSEIRSVVEETQRATKAPDKPVARLRVDRTVSAKRGPVSAANDNSRSVESACCA